MSEQAWREDERLAGRLHANGLPADVSVSVDASGSVWLRAAGRALTPAEAREIGLRLVDAASRAVPPEPPELPERVVDCDGDEWLQVERGQDAYRHGVPSLPWPIAQIEKHYGPVAKVPWRD